MVGPFQNKTFFSEEERNKVFNWIQDSISQEAWLKGYDYHLDEIDSKYEQKELWLNGAIELAHISNTYLDKDEKNKFVAIIFIPLYVDDIAKGYSFSSYWELDKDLDITPPSLFVCPYSWEGFINAFEKRDVVDYINSRNRRFDLYYFEELHDNGLEFVRNVTLVPTEVSRRLNL